MRSKSGIDRKSVIVPNSVWPGGQTVFAAGPAKGVKGGKGGRAASKSPPSPPFPAFRGAIGETVVRPPVATAGSLRCQSIAARITPASGHCIA